MEREVEGVCSVCNEPAAFKCSGCKQQFYCKKEHQRLDWPKHKLKCLAFEIRESPELGRYLIASRDLNPGDSILSETPLVWGPALRTDQRICVGCGRKCTKTDTRCMICLWPACDVNCTGLRDKNRHGMECSFIVKAKIIPRCEVLLVIRMLILWRRKSKVWSSIEKLQSHQESRGPGTSAFDETVNVFECVKRFLSGSKNDSTSDMDIVAKICGLIDVNALETVPPEGCVAIYENACLLEHSCLANTRHSFSIDDKGRPKITVKAVCSIAKGSHLSTMYTHALWATKARREHLMETKYFSCHCERCSDPTELNTHLGTLKCPQDNGSILPKDPLDFNSTWGCDSCPGILSASEVSQFLGKIEEDVDQVMETAKKETLIDLLSRLTALLHPGHQQCITVSHSLIQLLPGDDPRKSELCKHIVKTTKTLDPYGVRLALYTAVALRELSTCPGEDRRRLLSEAVTLLSQEPKESAGEKLRILIESEL
ncbi:SET domain-containing protein SmydA-8-like [Ceratina calcarata]|uniref:SET domain-containing protein SmydA-8-like n=1 Tax=Ceratina calcarata TaxID=156304 RepID=A0AAJ7JGS5_9HYME|nr:SET domain-containing protein SmydA-8-like [Ceratina calcarata]